MSNFQYGLISRVDSNAMEECFDIIFKEKPNEPIRYTEIGLYNGRTASGVKEYFLSKNYPYEIIGIDNCFLGEKLVFFPEDAKLIDGSSIEIYNRIEDGSQDFILIDGNHSFPYVVADFYCYKDKLRKGGYICFHDASPQTQWKGWQLIGDKDDPDMTIAVMKALEKIGLVGEKHNREWLGFELTCHVWDEDNEGCGVIIFKKLY
jgi:hypothetical protein